MKEKLYKRRGWARRAAAKLEWHTVIEMPYKYGFMVRPMAPEEKAHAMQQRSLNEIMREAFSPEIVKQLTNHCDLFRRLRRA